MRGHNPLALQVTTCAILGEFTRMFDGGHAVLTVLLVAWRIAIGFRFVAYSTGGFNLNLNGLLMD
jgi:hypothetical protein